MIHLRAAKVNQINAIESFDIFYDEPIVNELTDWDYPNHFFSYFKKNSTQLVVLLQGAIDRPKVEPPVFERWSWAEQINASVLSLNDPTILGNELRVGWWQGDENRYALPSACRFIELVLSKLGYSVKDLLFFGSSAGGFASMMMAGHLKGSVAVVNNPQTNILKSAYVPELLRVKFRSISKEEAFTRYPARFSVSALFKERHYIPKIVYYQNVKDMFHFENYYRSLIDELYETGLDMNEFESTLYSDERGHSAFSRSKGVSIINRQLARLSTP